MLISELVKVYHDRSDAIELLVPPQTALGQTGEEICEMISSYAEDAQVFLEIDDLVNSFAASSYGFGWIDAGAYLGYISPEKSEYIKITEEIPADLFKKLKEKTYRYQRMLNEAIKSVKIAPDSETAFYSASDVILAVAKRALSRGSCSLPNDLANALVEFSYGYGWLDCGVRSGLFSIHGNRRLFTI